MGPMGGQMSLPYQKQQPPAHMGRSGEIMGPPPQMVSPHAPHAPHAPPLGHLQQPGVVISGHGQVAQQAPTPTPPLDAGPGGSGGGERQGRGAKSRHKKRGEGDFARRGGVRGIRAP